MAKNVLRDMIGDKKKIVTMEDIEEAVAACFHVKIAEMKSRRRSKTIVHPRQIAMYLCRELTDRRFPKLAGFLAGKTIRRSCTRASRYEKQRGRQSLERKATRRVARGRTQGAKRFSGAERRQ